MTTFLVPRTLTWDKLCALYLWVRLCRPVWRFSSFAEVLRTGLFALCFEDEDRPAEFVDVDVVNKYTTTRHKSATERVAMDHGIDLPGTEYLVQLLNSNNATGNLKSFPQSFVTLIRELFNVGTDTPSRQRRIAVIDAMWPAVDTYFTACEKDETAVMKLSNPFTLESFRTVCHIAQVAGDKKGEWERSFEQLLISVQAKRSDAQQRAVEIPFESFDVPLTDGGMGIGHIITSDNTRVASEYLRRNRNVAILIVRRRNGNVAMFCGGPQNFDDLHTELERLEPGLWYMQQGNPSPMLLNGSTSRDRDPTKLTRVQLLQLIQAHYRHSPRR